MPEAHPGAERDQLGRLGRRNRFSPEPESLGRPPQQRDVAHRFGRRREYQLLGLGRERFESPQEAPLDLARQRPCVWKAESARQLGRRQAAGQLHQRERIAARLGDDPVPDPLVEYSRQRRGKQRARIAVCDPFDDQLRQTGELTGVVGLADGEHHRDPLGEQAPCHERQRLRGRAIEPLRVVDEAHQRTRLGRIGQQTQCRQGDQEVVRGPAFLQAERHPQSISLGARDPVEAVEDRRAQLVQTSERKLHLGLHPCRSRDTTPGRLLGDGVQQHRLADPWLAAQHQDPALPDPHICQQSVQCLALGAPAQHPRSVGRALHHALTDATPVDRGRPIAERLRPSALLGDWDRRLGC